MDKYLINTREKLKLIIKDKRDNLIDVDGYNYFEAPTCQIYINDTWLSDLIVQRESKGIYVAEVEFFEDYYELSNQYRIDWIYKVGGILNKKRDYFELIKPEYDIDSLFKSNPMRYLISEVRELVFDVNNPIRAFFIIRTSGTNSSLKLRKSRLVGYNNNEEEFNIDLEQFNDLNDLFFYLDDNHKDWLVTPDNYTNFKRKPTDLREFVTTSVASGIDLYFEYFFEDNRLSNIILESLVQFNRDFDSDFKVDTFPPEYLFAFKYLVSSNVTLVRASTDAKAFSQYFEDGRINNIMLGGKLEIGFANDGPFSVRRSVGSWLDLSKYYKELYEETLCKYNIHPYPLIEMCDR